MDPTTVLPRSSIRVSLNLPFRTDEVAEYLFRSDVLPYWLSAGAVLVPELGSDAKFQFPQHVRPLSGKVTSLDWPAAHVSTDTNTGQAFVGKLFELVVSLDVDPATTRIRFRLIPRAGQACRVRIECSGLTSVDQVHTVVKVWQSCLNRIGRLMAAAEKNHLRERQAVIVIHGIGEQRPGQLLRQFVENVFDRSAGEVHFIKPDYVTPLFEMHMATVPRNDAMRPTTDVYELYWAHLIRDTTVAQVYGWMLRLMSSGGHKIPHTLIKLVWGLRVTFVTAFLIFAWLMTTDVPGWLTSLGLGVLVSLPALASTSLRVLQDKFIVGYAGDAARYLEPRPENIAVRQAIREAGAQLLDALHDKGRYSRIIVYGHSLGSIIGYDIISHAWTRRSRRRSTRSKTSSRALLALENLLNPHGKDTVAVSAEEIQSLQYAAWLEYRRNGFEWLVSDFVTAGSPLTHARWLLNLDAKTQFVDLIRERSFPTCPPQTESIASPVPNVQRQVFTFTHAYVMDKRNPRVKHSVQVPHHAGLFALTRWTNLYFPYSGLINGDPIAGPLAGQYGEWIRDIKLKTMKGFTHNRYTDRDLDHEAVLQVRNALNLPFQRPLVNFAPLGLQPIVLRY